MGTLNSEKAILSVHKLERILIPTLAFEIYYISPETCSQMVFTMLAPIESLTSMNKSTTAILFTVYKPVDLRFLP